MSLPWSGKVSNAPGAICRRKRSFLPKMPMASSTDQSRSLVTFLYRCRFRIVVKKLVSSRCSSFYRLVADLTTHPSFGKIAGAILPKSTFPVQGRLGYEDRPSPPSSYVDSITEGAKHLPVGEGLDTKIAHHRHFLTLTALLKMQSIFLSGKAWMRVLPSQPTKAIIHFPQSYPSFCRWRSAPWTGAWQR